MCDVGVQVMSECPSTAVTHLGFTAGSGIPEPQIASVWRDLRVNVAVCLACSIPAPGHLLLSTARNEILGQPGRLLASSFGHSYKYFLSFLFCLSSLQLVSAEGSHSDAGSVCADNQTELPPSMERTGGIGDSRPPSFQ